MEIQKILNLSTSLLGCAHRNDVDGARRLLDGIDRRDRRSIVAKGDNDNAPLFVAAMRGNVDMVEFLVKECHADMEERGRYEDLELKSSYLVTPLWGAAASNYLDVVDLLINLGADINASSENGRTPILEACSTNVDVVEYLLKHGADVNIPGKDGETCLMVAVWSEEICQILIEYGATVNARDKSGNTALHRAITHHDYSDQEDVVQFLIDHGSDPFVKNEYGEDVFRKTCLEGYESILEKLLSRFEISVEHRIELYELLGCIFCWLCPGKPGQGVVFLEQSD